MLKYFQLNMDIKEAGDFIKQEEEEEEVEEKFDVETNFLPSHLTNQGQDHQAG